MIRIPSAHQEHWTSLVEEAFAEHIQGITPPKAHWVVTLRYRGMTDRIVIQADALAYDSAGAIAAAREDHDRYQLADSFESAHAYKTRKD